MAGATVRVGDESHSQFNREFKRLFGRSPGEEAREMRSAFALMEPARLVEAAAMHKGRSFCSTLGLCQALLQQCP
ncbi:hypothetical protein [Castellaniella denitrificans]|uniref:hypothetical protein n=1 Tax=Castellaniella denitrificans TaxID=56119 RepID=UPI0038B3C9EC